MTVPEVITRYNLQPPIECERVYSGLNDIYRVTTGGGPFILKLYRAGWRTQAEVLSEVAVLLHLGRKGAPVALPVPRSDGAFTSALAAPEGERQAVLFTEARGQPAAELDEAGCRRLGRALAEIHRATDDYENAPVGFDAEHLLERLLRALEPLLEDRAADWHYLQALARRLREQLFQEPQKALDWGFCHGDFRPANIHLDESGAVTVFDFDSGGTGFRAYDLAVFRAILFWWRSQYPDQEPLWKAFLSGYTEYRPLSVADREAIPFFVPLRPLYQLGALLQTAGKNRNLEPRTTSQGGSLPGFFDEVLRFLQEWDAACADRA